MLISDMGHAFPKHEMGRAGETESRPEVIPLQGLLHVEEGDAPTQEDDREQRFPVHVLKVAIPRKRHE
jgi:hypothetical protein